MSQHDLRKQIALAWINPRLEVEDSIEPKEGSTGRRKRKADMLGASSVSTPTEGQDVSESDHTKYTKKCHINDRTLDPDGALQCRIDRTLCHLPEIAEGRARYIIHRWVGIETLRCVVHCPTCNVNLCNKCYKIFHTTVDLVTIKSSLSSKYKRQKQLKNYTAKT